MKFSENILRFEEVKFQLSPSERSILAKFAKTRLFLLMDQMIELMKAFKYATVDLSSQSRQVQCILIYHCRHSFPVENMANKIKIKKKFFWPH